MAQKYGKFQELNTEIIPILVDNLKNAQKMEEKYAKGKFPILYDGNGKIAAALHQEKKFWKLGRMPGMLIVDKAGIIQFAYFGESMSDIPKNRDVLGILSNFSD